eukprot:Plantae.Rhodophyta-Hildenbrandia_rubra.ctg2547.p4 GENE.Plantae.Rhodophyta-Hildenbrandia_rubra.ctg2547~~Plantae.Rhodophyta-Hildenbrandia_rubra.ctg2547.p4  ORF type:complete len:132 (-),score=14.79 Plantae.Rhodophyta-Hildenbrandia_rubra.ctg2547:2705-3100(-)
MQLRDKNMQPRDKEKQLRDERKELALGPDAPYMQSASMPAKIAPAMGLCALKGSAPWPCESLGPGPLFARPCCEELCDEMMRRCSSRREDQRPSGLILLGNPGIGNFFKELLAKLLCGSLSARKEGGTFAA